MHTVKHWGHSHESYYNPLIKMQLHIGSKSQHQSILFATRCQKDSRAVMVHIAVNQKCCESRRQILLQITYLVGKVICVSNYVWVHSIWTTKELTGSFLFIIQNFEYISPQMCQRPDFLYLRAHRKSYLEGGLWGIHLWVYLKQVYFTILQLLFARWIFKTLAITVQSVFKKS